MIFVGSSAIRAVGYDARTRVLTIQFTSLQVYEYLDVPESEYHGLLSAESKGRYFSHNIRDHFEARQR
jgi:hypothetical protein